jgi:hypothetical protein
VPGFEGAQLARTKQIDRKTAIFFICELFCECYCRSMINWGELAPDSRDARLIAVELGVVIPKLNVPSPVM